VLPSTRYTQSHGADIAYKVVGQGPRDIVFNLAISHLDMLWELPEWADVVTQLAHWGRLILFDGRGTGLSDRRLTGITPEVRSDDVIAVMDAAGSTKAVLVGWMDSGAISLLTSARYPERVSAVVAGEALAVGHPDDDHPYGLDQTTREKMRGDLQFRSVGAGPSHQHPGARRLDYASAECLAGPV
jgi:pimeloyl-ACP methyl ester carboxylesterase